MGAQVTGGPEHPRLGAGPEGPAPWLRRVGQSLTLEDLINLRPSGRGCVERSDGCHCFGDPLINQITVVGDPLCSQVIR